MNEHPTYTKEEYNVAEEVFNECYESITSKEQAVKIANIASMLLAVSMPSLIEAFGKDFAQTSRKFMSDLETYCAFAEQSEYNNTKGIYLYVKNIIDMIREDIEDDKEE